MHPATSRSRSPLFDDRLETVLRTEAQSAAGERTQFRQLLDLLGTAPIGPDQTPGPANPARPASGTALARAYARLDELRARIPAADQIRILRETGLRIRTAHLVAYLAQCEPRVAASAIATARLGEADWVALIPSLPVISRGFLRHRRDLPAKAVQTLAQLGVGDLALPDLVRPDLVRPDLVRPDLVGADVDAPAPAPEPAPEPDPAPAPFIPAPVVPPRPEPDTLPKAEPEPIGALLERIERFRSGRRGPVLAPRLPLGDIAAGDAAQQIAWFDVQTDATGRAISASDPVAPWVCGMLLTAPAPGRLVQFDSCVATTLRQHQPVRAAALTITAAAPISGAWRMEAVPVFAPHDGAFAGYHCRLRRPLVPGSGAPPKQAAGSGDRMRQVLHELRTPVGAMQGFAEIIQQQMFGPVPHEYRAHAAAIAGDSARLLAGFDELDRLARLEDGAATLASGQTDFRAAIGETLDRLDQALRPRNAGFRLLAKNDPLMVGLDRMDALALCWRILATLAGALGPGEQAVLTLVRFEGHLRLACAPPAPLRDEATLVPQVPGTPAAISAGMFGPAFAFRLARAEATAAGGGLITNDGKLTLTLPLLTSAASTHSTAEPSGMV